MKSFFLLNFILFAYPVFSQNDIRVEYVTSESRADAQRLPLELGYEYLKLDVTFINPQEKISIIAPQGTKIEFAENSFVDKEGNEVTSRIRIQVKEAIEPADIILSSLHTVTSDGKTLQSKGMVEVTATSNGKEVFLANNKTMTLSMPVGFEEGYSYYQGVDEGDGVKWIEPQAISQTDDELERRVEAYYRRGGCGNRSRLYTPKIDQTMKDSLLETITVYFKNGKEQFLRSSYQPKLGRKAGLTKDQALVLKRWFSSSNVRAYQLAPYGRYTNDTKNLRMNIDLAKASLLFGMDARYIDPELANVFEMKKLGWANIDRLAKFPDAEKMRFVVAQNKIKEMDSLHLTLVVPSANIFIPAYQKEDGNYAFTFGEFQDSVLMPRNELAYIVALGKKGEQDYFELKEVRFGE
ncbi:MAG: hypothetical protein ACI857_003444, partial [Arenicella sp.]